MVDKEEFKLRKKALAVAKTYVDPLCLQYPPEAYSSHSGPSTIISSSGTYVVTAAEQPINLMIQIASWLVNDK